MYSRFVHLIDYTKNRSNWANSWFKIFLGVFLLAFLKYDTNFILFIQLCIIGI